MQRLVTQYGAQEKSPSKPACTHKLSSTSLSLHTHTGSQQVKPLLAYLLCHCGGEKAHTQHANAHSVEDKWASGSGQAGECHLVPSVHAEQQSAPHLGDSIACNYCQTTNCKPTCPHTQESVLYVAPAERRRNAIQVKKKFILLFQTLCVPSLPCSSCSRSYYVIIVMCWISDPFMYSNTCYVTTHLRQSLTSGFQLLICRVKHYNRKNRGWQNSSLIN